MNLFVFDIGEKKRLISRFIGSVRAELQKALLFEKASRKLTQQQMAEAIGTNRSVINREIMGLDNLSIRRIAELAWALGWEPYFELRKRNVVAQTVAESENPKASPSPIVKHQPTSINSQQVSDLIERLQRERSNQAPVDSDPTMVAA